MANNGSDGSIIIDTEMDQSGFEKGSEKMEEGMKSLTDTINTLGADFKAQFQTMTSLLQQLSSTTSQIYGAMTSSGQQAADAADNVAQAVQREGDALNAAGAGAQSFQGHVSNVDREAAALSRDLDKIDDSMSRGFSNSSAVLRFKETLDGAQEKADALKERLDALGAAQIPTEEYSDLTAELSKAEQKLLSLYNRQEKLKATGTKTNSKQWSALAYDIQNAEQEVARYETRIADLEARGGAFTSGVDTDQYQQLSAVLDAANAKIEDGRALINAEALEQAQLNVQAAQEGVIRATTNRQREAAQEKLREAQAELNRLAGESTTAAPKQDDTGRWSAFGNAVKGVGNALKSAAGAAVNLASKLAKMGVNAVSKGFKTLTSKLKEFTKQGKNSAVTSNALVKTLTSLKTLLKTRIKRMFITYLMNEIKAAMSGLVQFSSTFDAAVSGMRNGVSELSANLAVTFSGIVNAIAPAITSIINMLSQATSYLNAFFAMLSGKSTVTVAKKQTDSYADSLKDATGATKELNKANKTLGIDELNVISEDTTSGGGGGSDTADKFEEVSVDSLLPEDISGWFDRIKAAFEGGDWYGIGNIISEGLNTAISSVNDWLENTLRPTATTWAARIALALNGLVDGVNWVGMGVTLASGVNTVFDTLNTFLTTFNFEGLGAGIGNAINGLFDGVEWDLIGETFGNKWNALVNFIYGIVSTVKWDTVGSSIATAVSSWFNTVNWGKIALTIDTGFNGIVTAIHTFINETDWSDMGTKIGTAIYNLFHGIDWAELGKTLSDGFIGAFDFLSSAIQAIDWWQLGEDVKTYLVNIDWAACADAMFEAIGSALGGLCAFVGCLITDALSSVGEFFSAEIEACGGDVVAGILNGITTGP